MTDDEVGYPDFLSPHSNPIAVSGDSVFVVNTPADTLDVIDRKTGEIASRIHVGIDPVGLAVRPDGREVWVSNHVSDSVSVIDTDADSPTYLQVVATIQELDPDSKATRFDEPVGIAFASNEKAYVALSSENVIAVVEVQTRKIVKRIEIPAQDPRAITVRGGRLYVIPFESNNQTQISGGNGELDGDLTTFNAREHVLDNNNVLSVGAVVDIVKHPEVPDRDLFVLDTETDEVIEVVDTLGTLLYGLTVDSHGRVFVAQTDARNDANGRSGTEKHGLAEMENRAFLNQITSVDFDGDRAEPPSFINLEPLPPHHPAKEMALATPFAIQVSEDDTTLVVTAAGSDKLFTVDVESGDVLGRIQVDSVPRGIALESTADGKPSQAWVLNAVANTVSLVDLSDRANPVLVKRVTLEDPTHLEFKLGRIAFNNANASTTGTFSCESCHPDGHTDQLVWVLDTPISTGGDQIVPRLTMPARGLRDTAPYHWDGIPGDPYGGVNTASTREAVEPNSDINVPESSTRHLVDGGLATTMKRVGYTHKNDEGKQGELTGAERDLLAKFLLGVPYPPAQRRSYDNVVSKRAQEGFQLFHIDGDLQGDARANVCGNCHRMPYWVSTNTRGSGMDAPTWRGAYDRWMILPQGRLNIIDFNFYKSITDRGTPERSMWRLSWGGRSRFDPIWDMVLEGSTGFSGSFARQATMNKYFSKDSVAVDLLDTLEKSASEGGIVLHGDGVFVDPESKTATPVALRFNGSDYEVRRNRTKSFTRRELEGLASNGRFVGTFTGRLGRRSDHDHPQPALWSYGPIERQRGKQVFPTLSATNRSMTISGRHIQDGAHLVVNGRRVSGEIVLKEATHEGAADRDRDVTITLEALPNGLLQTKLVSVDNDVFAFVPTDNRLRTRWKGAVENEPFDTSDWIKGKSGVGYERGTGYESLIGIDVEREMRRNSSVYIRIPFMVEDPSVFTGLELRMQFDDGFVVYLNRKRIADENDPRRMTWNSDTGEDSHEARVGEFDRFNVSQGLPLLLPGRNILAIQGLNQSRGSSDFIIRPELIATRPAGDDAGPGSGMHLLQVQNPGGLFSNDYIFFTDAGQENLADPTLQRVKYSSP
ncbi:MAG TPA: YncE family protein [Verrucomicrobiales bacterium]|nr:YncE family protein [Verrucomicrobiales bacterium]